MDYINQIELALAELKPSTLNARWKTVWSECIKNRDPILPNTTKFSNIIILAHIIGGEGFDDLSFEDINDEIIEVVLKAPDLKEHSDKDKEDPISKCRLVKEGPEMTSKLSNHFVKHDFNEERAGKYQRDLK